MASLPLSSPLPTHGAPRCMIRCECTGVGFEELGRRMRDEGLTLPDVCCRTGCGEICTACLPDLRSYLHEQG